MIRKAFGARLRLLRKLAHRTQAELAERAGVTVEHLGNLERGVSAPSLALIARLSRALDVAPACLFEFEELESQDPVPVAPSNDDRRPWRDYLMRIGHWCYDPSRPEMRWSPALYSILGAKPGAIRPTLAAWTERVPVEERELFLHTWHDLLRGGTAQAFRFIRGDGAARLGVLHCESFGATGEGVMHGVLLDITEQARFERSLKITRQQLECAVQHRTRSLRRAKTRLERAVRAASRAVGALTRRVDRLEQELALLQVMAEHSPDALLVLDAGYRLRWASRAVESLTGWGAEEIGGVSWARLLTPEALRQARSVVDRRREARSVGRPERGGLRLTLALRRRSGDVAWVEVHSLPVYAHEIQFQGVVIVVRDAEQRVRGEERQRDALRFMRHELRTPAEAAVTVARVLRDELGRDDETDDLLTRLEALGRSMLSVLSVYADADALETRHRQPERLPVDMAELLAVDVDVVREARGGEIFLEVEGDGAGRWRVLGDRMLLSGMVVNLLRNALEASEGQPVRAILSRDGAFLRLSVRNAGVVPEALRDCLFEKYASGGKPGGRGIGAYLARLVAEAHGGRIGMETSEGRGTEIRVRLPLLAQG